MNYCRISRYFFPLGGGYLPGTSVRLVTTAYGQVNDVGNGFPVNGSIDELKGENRLWLVGSAETLRLFALEELLAHPSPSFKVASSSQQSDLCPLQFEIGILELIEPLRSLDAAVLQIMDSCGSGTHTHQQCIQVGLRDLILQVGDLLGCRQLAYGPLQPQGFFRK